MSEALRAPLAAGRKNRYAALMIQIFGSQKNRDTRKAIRFFKERRVPFQFIDLAEKPMSRGELESVARSVPLEELIDRDGAEFERLGLAHRELDPGEALLEHPLLFRMPVVRDKNRASAGLAEDEWKRWLKA
jgi:arsenate reductase